MKLTATQLAGIRTKILAAQGHVCALCGVSFKTRKRHAKTGKLVQAYTPCLDHCHTTGAIRGVLCNNCNGKEGKIKTLANACKRNGTSLEFLQKLVAYLVKHSEPQNPYIHPTHKTDDEKRLARNKKARLARAKLKAQRAVNNGL